MAFRVGQKCVFVRDPAAVAGTASGPRPVLGKTYTIRDIDCRMAPHGIPIILRFEEFVGNIITLSACLGGHEWEVGCDGRSFRPVVSTDTGMAVLEQIRRDV